MTDNSLILIHASNIPDNNLNDIKINKMIRFPLKTRLTNVRRMFFGSDLGVARGGELRYHVKTKIS